MADKWDNAKDSIYHALNHVSEVVSNKSEKEHHKKWIILSVHHAAECYLKNVLESIEPGSAYFSSKAGKPISIRNHELINMLEEKYSDKIYKSEKYLLKLLNDLNIIRNEIMHRGIVKLDVSIAALTILALLRAINRRNDILTSDIFDQDPPIEKDVLELVDTFKYDNYFDFVEESISEDNPQMKYFEACPVCGLNTLVDYKCQACFEEATTLNCHECDEDIIVPEDIYLRDEDFCKCPQCGKILK